MKVRVGDIVLSFSWKSLLFYQWKLCELSLRYCGLQLRKWHLRVVDWNFSGSTRTCQHRLHKNQNIYGHTSLYFTSWPLFFSFLHITNTWKQSTVYNTKIKYLIVFCQKKSNGIIFYSTHLVIREELIFEDGCVCISIKKITYVM